MKKSLLAFAVACVALASCEKNQSTAPTISKEDAAKAVGELFDAFNASFTKKDANTMATYLADDGLFLGTDPEEFWAKPRVVEEVSNMAKDSTVNANYTADKREIRVSPDGTSAIVVEQAVVPFLGKIPARTIAHAVMKDGQWRIDFYSWNLVPKNESLKTLSAAYQ